MLQVFGAMADRWKEREMSAADNGADAVLPRSTVSAGELLAGVAALIGDTPTVADLSTAAVERQLRIPLRTDSGGGFSAVAQLSATWSLLLDLRPGTASGPTLLLEFWPTDPTAEDGIAAVGDVDLEDFAARLESAGFRRTPWFGEHGRRMGHHFHRGSVRVTVDTEADSTDPTPSDREYIRGIRVQ